MNNLKWMLYFCIFLISAGFTGCTEDTELDSQQDLLTQELRIRGQGGQGPSGGNNNGGGNDESTTTTTTTTTNSDCTVGNTIDRSRGACSESLATDNSVSISESGSTRTIRANNIPDHLVGLFGSGQGALNPNAISPQNSEYHITMNPQLASRSTELSGSNGPQYSFGVLLNGVEMDPVAAEPWPHIRGSFTNVNWEWNLEATNVNLGLDCNNAHVQPTGKYHYHGSPTLYLSQLSISSGRMTLIGYAADGFPIYYKYAYMSPDNNASPVVEMLSSYQLKEGERPGDGVTAPCGTYDGVYSNDYEFSPSMGDLDECNGRSGVTPEYPEGTYYYVITDAFPSIPRCFVGTPSTDFRLGA